MGLFRKVLEAIRRLGARDQLLDKALIEVFEASKKNKREIALSYDDDIARLDADLRANLKRSPELYRQHKEAYYEAADKAQLRFIERITAEDNAFDAERRKVYSLYGNRI